MYVAFHGCSSEIDDIWNIEWPNTPRDTTAIQLCPGGQASIGMRTLILLLTAKNVSVYCRIGNAMRLCDNKGQWSEPNVLQCTSVELVTLEDSVCLMLFFLWFNNKAVLAPCITVITMDTVFVGKEYSIHS